MEGALGERLKREHRLRFDEHVAMAGLVYDAAGSAALCELWSDYAGIAHRHRLPFLATTPTRRANRERVSESRFHDSIIRDNVSLLRAVQHESLSDMYVGGLMGCKGDAYQVVDVPSAVEARSFHSWQAELCAQARADFLYAGIMPALPEAVGMAQAMSDSGLPYIISFMIRGNGRLLDGTTIHEAIQAIDGSVAREPVCYMTNCVHPTVLYEALSQPFNTTDLLSDRFWGIQANASPLPPEELDDATDLECSDASMLADAMMRLRDERQLRVFGGCCGTDRTHLEEIARGLSAKVSGGRGQRHDGPVQTA
jgi:S-methylmethionine-dependent homocysteine/selenocysteine methylase